LRRSHAPKKIILHVGHHRTGTTSIQSFLRDNRSSLGRQGIYVPHTGFSAKGNHHQLIERLSGGTGREKALEALREEVSHIPHRNVLVSSEAAKKKIVGGEGEALVEAFRDAGGARVHILLYLRSPFAHANSFYAERTATLFLGGATFAEHVDRLHQEACFNFGAFLALAERNDTFLTVRPYGLRAHRAIVRDFLTAIGADFQELVEPRLNRSLGPIALEAMRQIAAELGPISPARQHGLWPRLQELGRSVAEQPFWVIDEAEERRLQFADRATDAFTTALWGRRWREVFGEDRQPLNVFNPSTAVAQERDLWRGLLAKMRALAHS
jgi:hypothetical protein